MAVIHTLAQSARSSSILSMGTLANGTYLTSTAQDLGATIPPFFVLQAECDPNGTPSGNKQLVLFLKWSLDNTNFTSGPESGTTVTEEADLHWAGTMPTNDTNTHRKEFVVYPKGRYYKVVLKNDMGVALTSGDVYQANFTGSSV